MSTEPQVLARNTTYFLIALIGQKIISFVYFTLLARMLGPAAIGKYVLALSLTTIFSVFIDLGLASLLTREVARDKSAAEKYIGLIFSFKILAGLVVSGLLVLTVNILGYPLLTKQLVYIACLVMVLDSFILSIYATIRGLHNLMWESIGAILLQVCVTAIGLSFSLVTRDLRWFMLALLIGVGVHFVYALTRLRWIYHINIKPIINLSAWREMFKLAWPFALAAILIRIYGYIDTVLLSKLANDHAVGIYSVAYKITFALQFIPTAFSASLFPGFSSYFIKEPARLGDLFNRGVIYLTAIAVPISLGVVVIAPQLISKLYPGYAETVVPLQILMFSLIFLFITFPIGALLPACNKQKRNTFNIGLAAVASVVFNILLIPKLGPTGAAIASCLSTLTLLISGWLVVSRVINYDRKFLLKRLSLIIIAGLAMVLVAWWLEQSLNFILVIPLAAVVYLSLLVALGGISWVEIKSFINLVRNRNLV